MTTRPPQPDAIAMVALPHIFSKDERLAFSATQNAALGRVGAAQVRLRAFQREVEAEIAGEMATVTIIRKKLEAGSELRQREVLVKFDPTAGTKEFFDRDTGEKLGGGEMGPENYEMPLL